MNGDDRHSKAQNDSYAGRNISARFALDCRTHLQLGLLILLLVDCGKSELKPVDLLPEDMCATCKMAISQKGFAAEILDSEQMAVKFDDIGCLVRFTSKRDQKDKVSAWFVMDYVSKTWVDAKEAWYVRNSSIRTPMGSGIVAYREKSQAESAAVQAHVQVQVFSEIVP